MRPVDPRLIRLPGMPGYLAATVLSAAVAALLVIFQAGALARVVATGFTGRLDRVALLALLVVVALRAGRHALSGWLGARTTARIKADLRARMLARAVARGPGWLAGQRAGELATLAGRGVDALDAYLTGYLPQLVLGVTVPVAVLLRIALADLPSALIVLVTLPLIPIFAILVGWQTQARTQKQWRLLARLGGHFLDMLGGLSTLRSFGRARAQVVAVGAMADRYRAATMGTLRLAFLSALVLELIGSLSVALVAVPIGLRLLHGTLTLPVALLVLILAPEAYNPLRAAGAKFHASQEGLVAVAEVFEVIDDPPTDPPPADPPPARAVARQPDPGQAELVFDRITVRGLRDASFRVRPGERVALIGPSGGGKTTLLALLLGLLSPDGGRVLVDGVDLAELDLDAWRAGLAWVPQRPHLFADTVAANIALGAPDADPARIAAAAAAAHADGFITALPDGYGTRLGERGVGLSSGQRQRLALARAFLREHAGLVLLDEPTARLDGQSEQAVLDGSAALVRGRTALVVAHRPALLAVTDRAVVIRDGRATEAPRSVVPVCGG